MEGLGGADRPRAIRPPGPGDGTAGAADDVDAGTWQVLASFVVEFRARRRGGVPERIAVHHVELDRTEVVAGAEVDRAGAWMRDQIPPPLLVHPGSGPTGPPAVPLRAVVDEEASANASANAAGTLVALDRPWSVLFEWSAEEADLPPGDWLLDVILEPIGPGRPRTLRTRPVPVPASRPSGYREHFVVLAGAVPGTCTDTLFRATATLRFRSTSHERALLAGVVDLGVLRFWNTGSTPVGVPTALGTRAR